MGRPRWIAILCLLVLLSLSVSIPTFANPLAPDNAEPVPLYASVTLAPVADAHVNSAYPNTNYGTATELKLDGSPTKRGYLGFNVSGLSSAVSKATLRFYANSSLASGVTVKRVADNTWGEMISMTISMGWWRRQVSGTLRFAATALTTICR